MTELFKIIGIGLLTLITYIIVKPLKPDVAVFISIIGSVIILMFCIDAVTDVIFQINIFVEKAGINSQLFACVLKIVGIGYIVEFSSNLCVDAGNSSLADKISLAGKITILVMSMPIISNLLNIIIEIMP